MKGAPLSSAARRSALWILAQCLVDLADEQALELIARVAAVLLLHSIEAYEALGLQRLWWDWGKKIKIIVTALQCSAVTVAWGESSLARCLTSCTMPSINIL